MIEPRSQLDLAQKPLRAQGRSEIRMENLQGHDAVMLYILRKVNGGHSALSELAIDGVVLTKRITYSFQLDRLHHILSTRALYRGTVRSGSRSLSCSIHARSP